MPLMNQLLLTLMKLRHNFGHVDLATRFNCSTATVTNIFLTIVSVLYDILYDGTLENNILFYCLQCVNILWTVGYTLYQHSLPYRLYKSVVLKVDSMDYVGSFTRV